MFHPISITGPAGGTAASTGRLLATFLTEDAIPVRAFVPKLDSRSDERRKQGGEVEGGLRDPAFVESTWRDIQRAPCTYPTDGRAEPATISGRAVREVRQELAVNDLKMQGRRA